LLLKQLACCYLPAVADQVAWMLGLLLKQLASYYIPVSVLVVYILQMMLLLLEQLASCYLPDVAALVA
jgi:hypothetical protein